MDDSKDKLSALRAENEDLRARLEEAEDMLRAIRGGEVDALVIEDQVYRLESAAAASNRFRGEVLAQINDVVVAVDNESRITYLNPAAERQYKTDASKALGRKLSDIYTDEWLDPSDEKLAQESLREHGFWRGENIHRLPDQTAIFVESLVNILRDRDGSASGLLAVIRDAGERKAAEAALIKAHDELEARVSERTRELAETNAALHKEILVRKSSENQRLELLKKLVTSQEDERRRIARDIHDHLGQRVTAVRMQIEAFADIIKDESKFARRIETLREAAELLDTDVSFLAWELRPASLDDLGLAEAVREFLKDWSNHYETEADFNVRGFGHRRLLAEIETHLYRIVQESLHNIAKHANAKQVNVLLEWGGDEVALIVEDNGDGFDVAALEPARESGGGLGLLGMRERAALVGGAVQIESIPRVGTTVYARVPALDADGREFA